VSQEFWREAWSWPVLEKLIEGSQGVENVLSGMEGMAGMEDAALLGEIRAAALEPSESLTVEHVYASVQKLFDAHLSRKKQAILEELEELKKRGNEGAPVDLLKRLQEIQSERSRVANTLKARA
jgi:glutamate synthase domain-containing protein 3